MEAGQQEESVRQFWPPAASKTAAHTKCEEEQPSHARPVQAECAAWVRLVPRETQEGTDSQVSSHVSYQQPWEGE